MNNELEFVEIESIEEIEDGDTYDIWNFAGDAYNDSGLQEGNFFVSGVLVHNSIPDAMKNRDDVHARWKKKLHAEILRVLEDTYGVIVYQEQLQQLWQNIAGFTTPKAQEARKAVAKKWEHKLKPIREEWLAGAGPVLGVAEAEQWWEKMKTFGRYAFNKSHSVSYCLIAYSCLWLKAHFAPEWWAAVMSGCHREKLIRYMGIARSEIWTPTDITYCGKFKSVEKVTSVQFGTINLNNLTESFTVTGDVINQGLIGIKGIGKKMCKKFVGQCDANDIDSFVATGRKNKAAIERFIKLGAFKAMPGHENAKALWQWYQYNYCSGKNVTQLRKDVKARLLEMDGWNPQTIKAEIDRQVKAYKALYPKRHKIPPKIAKWTPPPNDTRERVMALFKDDKYTMMEWLEFQMEYLGYYIDSPLCMYKTNGCTIAKAKELYIAEEEPVRLDALVVNQEFAMTKTNKQYLKLAVTDGIQRVTIMIWSNELRLQRPEVLVVGAAISMRVQYDQERRIFALGRSEMITMLKPK